MIWYSRMEKLDFRVIWLFLHPPQQICGACWNAFFKNFTFFSISQLIEQIERPTVSQMTPLEPEKHISSQQRPKGKIKQCLVLALSVRQRLLQNWVKVWTPLLTKIRPIFKFSTGVGSHQSGKEGLKIWKKISICGALTSLGLCLFSFENNFFGKLLNISSGGHTNSRIVLKFDLSILEYHIITHVKVYFPSQTSFLNNLSKVKGKCVILRFFCLQSICFGYKTCSPISMKLWVKILLWMLNKNFRRVLVCDKFKLLLFCDFECPKTYETPCNIYLFTICKIVRHRQIVAFPNTKFTTDQSQLPKSQVVSFEIAVWDLYYKECQMNIRYSNCN